MTVYIAELSNDMDVGYSLQVKFCALHSWTLHKRNLGTLEDWQCEECKTAVIEMDVDVEY